MYIYIFISYKYIILGTPNKSFFRFGRSFLLPANIQPASSSHDFGLWAPAEPRTPGSRTSASSCVSQHLPFTPWAFVGFTHCEARPRAAENQNKKDPVAMWPARRWSTPEIGVTISMIHQNNLQ